MLLIEKGNRPTLMFLPFTVGAYAAVGSFNQATLSIQLPTDARFAALGLINADNEARLFDQHVLSMKHDDYDAIARDEQESTLESPGVPLAHVCSFLNHQALDGQSSQTSVTLTGALTDSLDGPTEADGTVNDITDPADTPASADALRDDLVANTIPSLVDAIEELLVKINAVRGNLGTVVTNQAILAAALNPFTRRGFQPWPGRFNDALPVLRRIALGQRNAMDDLRLLLCDWIPGVKPCTLWPLVGGKKFEMVLRRPYGANSVSRMYLVVIRLPDAMHERMCSSLKLSERPRWYSRFWDLASTAGVEADFIERPFSFDTGYGLRWMQRFMTGYDNNGGTVTYDETAINTILFREELQNQGKLLPPAADNQNLAPLLAAQMLQHYDPAMDPGIVIPDREILKADIGKDASSNNARDVYVSYYGVLRPQDRNGFIQDAE